MRVGWPGGAIGGRVPRGGLSGVPCLLAADASGRRQPVALEGLGHAAGHLGASAAMGLHLRHRQISGACSQVTGGVTETLECDRLPAATRVCSE